MRPLSLNAYVTTPAAADPPRTSNRAATSRLMRLSFMRSSCLHSAYQRLRRSAALTVVFQSGTRRAPGSKGLSHEVGIMKIVLAILISMTLATPLAAQDVTGSSVSGQAVTTDQLKKDEVPEHAHTGWATLLKDTGHDFLAFPRR